MVSELENADKDEANELERLECTNHFSVVENLYPYVVKKRLPFVDDLRGEPLHFYRFLLRV